MDILGYFDPEFQSQTFGELFTKFVLESHFLPTINKVGSRAIECQHYQFPTVFNLRKITCCFILFAMMFVPASEYTAQKYKKQGEDQCLGTQIGRASCRERV